RAGRYEDEQGGRAEVIDDQPLQQAVRDVGVEDARRRGAYFRPQQTVDVERLAGDANLAAEFFLRVRSKALECESLRRVNHFVAAQKDFHRHVEIIDNVRRHHGIELAPRRKQRSIDADNAERIALQPADQVFEPPISVAGGGGRAFSGVPELEMTADTSDLRPRKLFPNLDER